MQFPNASVSPEFYPRISATVEVNVVPKNAFQQPDMNVIAVVVTPGNRSSQFHFQLHPPPVQSGGIQSLLHVSCSPHKSMGSFP